MTEATETGPPVLQDMRILVAEDEAMIALMVEDILTDAGAQVLGPAISVDIALQMIGSALANGGLNAAVLDVQLGHDKAAEALRAAGVPYLFATGHDGHPMLEEHPEVPVLSKPYHPEELLRIVARLCQARR